MSESLNSFSNKKQNNLADAKIKISDFPIMLFAVAMGVGGLGIAYKKMSDFFELPNEILIMLTILESVIVVGFSIIYLIKLSRFSNAVRAEISHPIKINFFGAFSVSWFLLSFLLNTTFQNDMICTIANTIFYIFLIFQTLYTLYVISSWLSRDLLITHANPAWFIPVVGNLVIPIIAPQNVNTGVLWYYFWLGTFFWICLFTIIFYRLIFHEQIMPKLTPTLFILLAPPAIAFIGYTKLSGVDNFSLAMLNLTLFFVTLATFIARKFIGLKFAISWWAFTFPSAAVCLAFLRAYELNGMQFWLILGTGAFIILSLLVTFIGYKTIRAWQKNELIEKEG